MLLRAVFAALVASSAVFGLVAEEPTDDFNPPTAVENPSYDDLAEALPLTNAARFQRGLGPLPPALNRRGVLHAPGPVSPPPIPTPVDVAPPAPAPPLPSLSASPPLQFKGRLQVRHAKSGAVLGYVPRAVNKFGELGLAKDAPDALTIDLRVPRALAAHSSFGIPITNSAVKALPFLGAVANVRTVRGALTTGKESFAYLALTGQTKAGVPAGKVASSFDAHTKLEQAGASAIWSINPLTARLSAKWTNPDRSQHYTTLFFYPAADALVVSTDPAGFARAYPSAVPVVISVTQQ